VQLKDTPIDALAGQVTMTISGVLATLTVKEPDASALLASVTVKDSVCIPLTDSTAGKTPVPAYGPVPPIAETEQLKETPAVTLEAHDTVTTKGCGATVTVAVTVATTLFASVTLKDSIAVPLLETVRLAKPIPEYGLVPPVAVTVQLNGLPAVTPDVGHDTVTVSGCAATLTLAEPLALAALASVAVKDSVLTPFVGSVLLSVPVPV